MGNSASPGEELYNPDKFEVINENLNDQRYGEIKILREKETGQLFAELTFNFANQEEYEEKQEVCQREAIQEHDSLVKIVKYTAQKIQEFCSSFWKVQILIQYLPDNLYQDILSRVKNNDQAQIPYDESELWHILVSVIAALGYLKHRGAMHGDIRPSTILLDSDKRVKVLSRTLFQRQPSHFQECQQNIQQAQGIYLSPIQLKGIECHQEPLKSVSKSDVWSLGVSVLEAANLQPCRDIYNLQTFDIDQNNLNKHINLARTKYSSIFCEFLQKMLTVDEKNRPDVDNLYGIIEEQCQNGLIVSNSLITSPNKARPQQNQNMSQSSAFNQSQQQQPNVQRQEDPNKIPELQQISQGLPAQEQVVYAPEQVAHRQATQPQQQQQQYQQQREFVNTPQPKGQTPQRRQERVRRSPWAVDTDNTYNNPTPKSQSQSNYYQAQNEQPRHYSQIPEGYKKVPEYRIVEDRPDSYRESQIRPVNRQTPLNIAYQDQQPNIGQQQRQVTTQQVTTTTNTQYVEDHRKRVY